MTQKLLICADLERTLIPDGHEPESPNARSFFKQLCQYKDVALVYLRMVDLLPESAGEYQAVESF